MEPRSRIEAEIKMADGKLVKKFLLTNPHFELFRDDQNREKVRCKLTGHELPPRLSDLENYTKGKKYQRFIKNVPNESPHFEEFKEFLVPSDKNRNQLYCQFTKRYINNAPHHIQRHVTGKRFVRALKKHREQQKLENEKSDEEMWVPSDLESESASEEEKDDEKKEEDSGGEFSSEEEEDTYERKDQASVKRRLKETKKDKSTKKLKASCGTKEGKSMKQPKKLKTKKSIKT